MDQPSPVIDLSFEIRGTSVPADHGYALYAALARCLPWVHGDKATGIHPIRGQLIGGRMLALTRASRLVLRLPASKIPEAISLAGQRLDVDGAALTVGVPAVHPLHPSPSLASRLVVIRGFTEAGSFLEAVTRHLAELGVQGSAALVAHSRQLPLESKAGGRSPFVRRTLRISGREVVGFALRVEGLGPEDSLSLQAAGLGGRRRFGCGVFQGTGRTQA